MMLREDDPFYEAGIRTLQEAHFLMWLSHCLTKDKKAEHDKICSEKDCIIRKLHPCDTIFEANQNK